MDSELSPGVPIRAKEVLESFLRSPGTLQDFQEVIRWRLPRAIAEITIEQVTNALLWLCDREYLVEEEPGPDRSIRYRLNPKRESEAWDFLVDPSGHHRERGDEGGLQRSPLLSRAIAWIDETFNRYLKEHSSADDEENGLTRSRASIDALLYRRRPSLGRNVHSARRGAMEAAREFTEMLMGPSKEPLAVFYRTLRMTLPELQAVLLCLAPELDAAYQVIYGKLNDDMSRRTPTLSLICGLLGDSLKVRTELAASAGLTRWRIIEPHGAVLPHGDDPLRLDASLVCWLLGPPDALFRDPIVGQSIHVAPWPGASWVNGAQDYADVTRVSDWLLDQSSRPDASRWLALCGEDSDGWRAVVENAAIAAAAKTEDGLTLARLLPVLGAFDPALREEACARVVRAVLLLEAVPVLDLAATSIEADAVEWLSAMIAHLTIGSRRGLVIAADLDRIVSIAPLQGCGIATRKAPTQASRAAAYLSAMSEAALYLSSADAAQTAAAFPLSLSGIQSAVQLAAMNVTSDNGFAAQASALTDACRKVAAPNLPRFARRVEPTFTLNDIVLPGDRLSQLREIVAHVKLAGQVLNNWGFGGQLPYGRGVTALFTGPSGCGKTMAAQAIAHELSTEAYVLDLSLVLSKYIGESEKAIDAAFQDAQRAGAVLQIDEAEALFGRRSEVKDSHDRFANLEVANLLQKIETFSGVVVLTSNLRQNVDQAFFRRLRFVIDFPKPDASAREKIWRQCLPKDAPIKDINFRFLSRRLELTGGHIRQITVRAAFAAARENGKAIEMRHLVHATRAELVKLGMVSAERDLAGWESVQVA
jgi:ATP-dependent 26S proteasome regulatory subunit